ncbi:endonuclease domain-containing protein [Streptomyces sp. NPDC046925]|uniref:endonuclease domain-containing protein n=1 Tax=Streptomyces sp. NPDC046925 TaxID=3155375 RepID=UPI0033D6E561
MEISYRTENRHHPEGKLCHHYAEYRLSCDEFDSLHARAAGCCEICRTPQNETGGKRLVIDHYQDRNESFVRGLLCDKCNAVMACFDGRKRWGANRSWEAAARRYAANSWQARNSGLQTTALVRPLHRT